MNFQLSQPISQQMGLLQKGTPGADASLPNMHLRGCACAACTSKGAHGPVFSAQDNAGEEPEQFFETVSFFNNRGRQFRWDQPNGLGTRVNITYALADNFRLNGLSFAQSRNLFEEALEVWAEVSPLNFREIDDPGRDDQVDIRVKSDFIDGNSNTLAFAFFPQGGDITFDSGESSWSSSLFLETAVHEIGHALGLDHDDSVDAIMNSVIRGRFNGPGTAFLLQDDIAGIRSLYGRGVGSVDPLGPDPAPPQTPPPNSEFNVIAGNANDNRLVGTGGRDRIVGRAGDDLLNGRAARDLLNGGNGDDTLNGGNGNDTLNGQKGRDRLVGGRGNDSLVGGNGQDTLIGTQSTDARPGNREIDTLTGGDSADTFILGNRNTVFYRDADSSPEYALITDFDPREGDRLRLTGEAGDYSLGNSSGNLPNGRTLIFGQGQDSEIIAVIQSPRNFSLNTNTTRYI